MSIHNRIEVMHGVNLDMLGRRDPAHYGELTPAVRFPRIEFGREPSTEAALFPVHTRRASSSSTCTGSRAWPTESC